MKKRILITGALDPDAVAALKARADLQIDYRPDCPRKELLELVATAQVLITRSETDVDRELMDRAVELKIVGRAAVGVGNIDIDYATEKGILVINTPGKNTNSAAELTMALILAMLRHVPEAYNEVFKGGWDRHRFTGNELRGKTLGIVGLGNVGHRVARFAQAFDMRVLAYDPYISPEVFERHGAKAISSLTELASQVDILTLHVPLNKETKGLIDRDVLASLKKGAYVVNAARGGIVSEEHLFEFLKSGHLAGAGIDTWETEPKVLEKLRTLPNVYGTPHIGASTYEAQAAIGQTIVEQVLKAIDGGVVDHPVNLPQLAVIDNPLLKVYAVLAEKLGSFIGQIVDFNPLFVKLSYRGDLAHFDPALVRLSWMKGYAGQVVDGFVSFVNVNSHFERLGIRVEEVADPSFAGYKSALKAEVVGAEGKRLTVGGIVFDDRYVRLSLVNDFYFEVEPTGYLILLENHDRPGVIGDVGQFLAQHGINIDSFELSRNRRGGKAMALIRVDSELGADNLKALEKIKNVTSVRLVQL